MPAKDLYYDAVKSALIKDSWTILADPYLIKYKDIDLYADLAAERPISVEREGQKIVVEIKSFVGRSLMTDFHLAVGQYKVYQTLLQETVPECDLYLAIDDITYNNFSGVRELNSWFDPIKSSFLWSTSMNRRFCNG